MKLKTTKNREKIIKRELTKTNAKDSNKSNNYKKQKSQTVNRLKEDIKNVCLNDWHTKWLTVKEAQSANENKNFNLNFFQLKNIRDKQVVIKSS